MINFPEIDLKDGKTLIIIFFLFLVLYICNKLPINVILSSIFILIFLTYYKSVYKNIDKDLFTESKGDNIYYNNKIKKLLSEIKDYKYLSPHNYKRGIQLWKSFIKEIKLLEDDRLYNYIQHFENAEYYLKNSINIFMSLGIGAQERKYIDAIEYNDFEDTKELNRISRISRELYQEGYNILYNLSIILNKKFEKEPNIHNKEVVLNYPQPYEKKKNKYDYF